MSNRYTEENSITATLIKEDLAGAESEPGTNVAVHHCTHYEYDREISLGLQQVRLRPAPHCKTPIKAYSMKILPKEHFINWYQDPFGNYVASIKVPRKVKVFRIEVDLIVNMKPMNPFDFFLTESHMAYPFHYESYLAEELYPFLVLRERDHEIESWLQQNQLSKGTLIEFLVNMNQQVWQDIQYELRMEPGVQTPAETLSKGTGSCRDMAWFLCLALRHLGFATRFCSGYLIQLKRGIKELDIPEGPETNIADLHAWTEVYLPDAGWIGLDPSSGLCTSEGHIPLCASPSPSSASPVSGLMESCNSKMQFHMDLSTLSEERSRGLPYNDLEWEEICRLGDRISNDLVTRDVRLTVGGEPTFVCHDEREADEWVAKAVGGKKRTKGEKLLKRLSNAFAKGSILHYGQGKWYANEELPRWALNCYWRDDGDDVWKNHKLLADENSQRKITIEKAKEFLITLARYFGYGQEAVQSVYEKNETKEAGFIFPLIYGKKEQEWISCRWSEGNERVRLVKGDSQLGYRLPIETLFQGDDFAGTFHERDLFDQNVPLPSYKDFEDKIKGQYQRSTHKTLESYPLGYVRQGICIQIRNGCCYLFLPPTTLLEHFLEMIVAIELAASELNFPVILEGYNPPTDVRLKQFSVTPDPGVLEINIHPSSSWEEIVHKYEVIYHEAMNCRLSPERFLLDGQRVGSGGGHHLVLGGKVPKDSPFLRRGDLIRSFITFWQHHPSLSYLFSSMYVGPTSQSPRIDEARHDSLYELEIGFRQIEEGQPLPYHFIDRLLRNVLVDVTGNRHRTEFCIDKLFHPESSQDRQGLLEIRCIEMLPHYQMALMPILLVHALTDYFWRKPYTGKLIRFGTSLHDRFMLPTVIWSDFKEIIDLLNREGYPLKIEWFLPHFDFRFPKLGIVEIEGVTLSLQKALEPWPILGEEVVSQATSRTVDSSVERLQVKVSGKLEEHYLITCNGFPLPLHRTEKQDEYIAGVRYKAWSPPYNLHPYIPIHTPLVFDIIDTHHSRSLGGCKYHSSAPGGRSYKKTPVNVDEASARLLSKFEPFGHTPGKIIVKSVDADPEFPYTLDLRRYSGH